MFYYLLKRLLLLVPTLWVISTVVFILSKLIPGDVAAAFVDRSEDTATSSVSSQTRQRAYNQLKRKRGEHLPLFYIHLQTAAEPDTSYELLPSYEREFLKKMTFSYGTWAEIVAYYNSLKELQTQVSKRGEDLLFKDKAQVLRQVDILFEAPEEGKVKKVFATLKKLISKGTRLQQVSDQAYAAYLQVISNAAPYKKFIPVIQWNGFDNQYHQWFVKALTGDLGVSYRDAQPVVSILSEAIGNTLLLSICSLLLVFILAIGITVFIVNENHKHWQGPVLGVLYVLDTIPVFLLALLLLVILSGSDFLALFPVYGLGEANDYDWWEGLSVRLYHLTIPVFCLTLVALPYVTTQLYQAMREVQLQDYITTAKAKGLPEYKVVGKHMLRNASLPLITLFTDFLPSLVGGALVIEVIFAIPGAGSLLVQAVLARDYPVILGIVLLIALFKAVSHVLADILYYFADPRIKLY